MYRLLPARYVKRFYKFDEAIKFSTTALLFCPISCSIAPPPLLPNPIISYKVCLSRYLPSRPMFLSSSTCLLRFGHLYQWPIVTIALNAQTDKGSYRRQLPGKPAKTSLLRTSKSPHQKPTKSEFRSTTLVFAIRTHTPSPVRILRVLSPLSWVTRVRVLWRVLERV